MDQTAEIIKFTKITLNVEEKTKGKFIYTTFTIEKDGKNSKLYNALTKKGLFSITLNGKKGIIGTYGFYGKDFKIDNCIYSDKLISIPFEANQNEDKEKSNHGVNKISS